MPLFARLRFLSPNRLSAALLVSSSLLWNMKAAPTIAGISVFGFGGYLVAAYLVWRLLRAIKRSGDISSKR
jgi:ubiquinone biosynthesis protein